MGLTYKAVQFRATKHHGADAKHSEHWDSFSEYDRTETRFCIVSTETGEILDDAQGYGYKTAQKAYAGFAYKNRDKSKDKERQAKKKHIETWMKEHKSFIRLMDACAFDIIKGAAAPDDKINAEFVKELLKENDLEPDFTAGDLLKVWQSR